MFKRLLLVLAGLIAAGTLLSQSTVGIRPNHPPAVRAAIQPQTPTVFGDPLPGLNSTASMNFTVGKAQFQVFDGPADGLGPIFNAQSCVVCHTQPITSANPSVVNNGGNPAIVSGITTGGASAITETRAGSINPSTGAFVPGRSNFNPLTNEDGTLFHLSSLTPYGAYQSGAKGFDMVNSQETVPPNATIVAHRKTTPIFGDGLIEAIPDATIKANVHNPAVDGVTGRAPILTDPVTTAIAASGVGPSNHVGRFGWKSQEATLLAFSGDAYLNEVGVTNRFFTTDLAPDGNQANLSAAEPLGYSLQTPNTPTTQLTPTTLQDLPANPALPESPTNTDDIARFTNFMELLANPPTLPLTPQALQGQQLFTTVNCVACHKASMQTGPSNVSPALAFKNVACYSDLLLHNMGSLADGIAQAQAGTTEMRTAPLWGLRGRSPFLHDGRAATVLQAIQAHDATGAESQIIAKRFEALPNSQQQAIIAFLESI
jgi:CxxC motif-containing protein (DUF1111 family)